VRRPDDVPHFTIPGHVPFLRVTVELVAEEDHDPPESYLTTALLKVGTTRAFQTGKLYPCGLIICGPRDGAVTPARSATAYGQPTELLRSQSVQKTAAGQPVSVPIFSTTTSTSPNGFRSNSIGFSRPAVSGLR
jgi:hypothetical protein